MNRPAEQKIKMYCFQNLGQEALLPQGVTQNVERFKAYDVNLVA